ncbi:MAG: hypothetical protein M3Z31_16205 [Pseudomonadota bacterium]|nr:hypothetical protein [Pseudomonadota bacterium]
MKIIAMATVVLACVTFSGCMVATATMAVGSAAVAVGGVAVSAVTAAGGAVVSGTSAVVKAVTPGAKRDELRSVQHDAEAEGEGCTRDSEWQPHACPDASQSEAYGEIGHAAAPDVAEPPRDRMDARHGESTTNERRPAEPSGASTS